MDFRHANYVLEGVLEDLEADRLTDALIRLQEATPDQAREYARQRAALAKPKSAGGAPSTSAVPAAKPVIDKHRANFDRYSTPLNKVGLNQHEGSEDQRPSWTPLPKSATKFGPRPKIEGKKNKKLGSPSFKFKAVMKRREERIAREEAQAQHLEGEAEDNAFKSAVASSQKNKPKPPTNSFNSGQRPATISGKPTTVPVGTKTMTKRPDGGYTPGK